MLNEIKPTANKTNHTTHAELPSHHSETNVTNNQVLKNLANNHIFNDGNHTIPIKLNANHVVLNDHVLNNQTKNQTFNEINQPANHTNRTFIVNVTLNSVSPSGLLLKLNELHRREEDFLNYLNGVPQETDSATKYINSSFNNFLEWTRGQRRDILKMSHSMSKDYTKKMESVLNNVHDELKRLERMGKDFQLTINGKAEENMETVAKLISAINEKIENRIKVLHNDARMEITKHWKGFETFYHSVNASLENLKASSGRVAQATMEMLKRSQAQFEETLPAKLAPIATLIQHEIPIGNDFSQKLISNNIHKALQKLLQDSSAQSKEVEDFRSKLGNSLRSVVNLSASIFSDINNKLQRLENQHKTLKSKTGDPMESFTKKQAEIGKLLSYYNSKLLQVQSMNQYTPTSLDDEPLVDLKTVDKMLNQDSILFVRQIVDQMKHNFEGKVTVPKMNQIWENVNLNQSQIVLENWNRFMNFSVQQLKMHSKRVENAVMLQADSNIKAFGPRIEVSHIRMKRLYNQLEKIDNEEKQLHSLLNQTRVVPNPDHAVEIADFKNNINSNITRQVDQFGQNEKANFMTKYTKMEEICENLYYNVQTEYASRWNSATEVYSNYTVNVERGERQLQDIGVGMQKLLEKMSQLQQEQMKALGATRLNSTLGQFPQIDLPPEQYGGEFTRQLYARIDKDMEAITKRAPTVQRILLNQIHRFQHNFRRIKLKLDDLNNYIRGTGVLSNF